MLSLTHFELTDALLRLLVHQPLLRHLSVPRTCVTEASDGLQLTQLTHLSLCFLFNTGGGEWVLNKDVGKYGRV